MKTSFRRAPKSHSHLMLYYCYFLVATGAQKHRRKISASPKNLGFSLLELVVVIAILGVLTAVSLPALMGNTERARVVAAKAALQNAISECAVAKQDGMSQQQLTFIGGGGTLNADIVPTLFSRPDGYRFDESRGGCHAMYLIPVGKDGVQLLRQGYPILQAKLASRGRIIKAFQFCQSSDSVDLISDCESWDSAGETQVEDCTAGKARAACRARNTQKNYSSNREDLDNPSGSWELRS